MAISRSVRPSVIVSGVVVRVRELRRKSDQTVYGNEVVLSQDSGAQVAVTVYVRDDFTAPLPGIGEPWAAVATVEESRDFGATLIYEEPPTASALDAIYASLSVTK